MVISVLGALALPIAGALLALRGRLPFTRPPSTTRHGFDVLSSRLR